MSTLSSNKRMPRSVLEDEDGASAVEWAVLASCIAAVVVLSIAGLGQNLAGLYGGTAAVIRVFL